MLGSLVDIRDFLALCHACVEEVNVLTVHKHNYGHHTAPMMFICGPDRPIGIPMSPIEGLNLVHSLVESPWF